MKKILGRRKRMTSNELIQKLLAAKQASEIFTNGDVKKMYLKYVLLIHPDRCYHPKAEEAMAVLHGFKDSITKGDKDTDGVVNFKRFPKKIITAVEDRNKVFITSSINAYKNISTKPNTEVVLKYMPTVMGYNSGKTLLATKFRTRMVSIKDLTLEQVHVNWVFSRLFEFIVLLRQSGFVHLGINPNTVFISPENHGIGISSFYHTKKHNSTITTIDSNYKHWYPASMFREKQADSSIDLELAKRLACWLLGDKSGNGTILKRDSKVNQRMLEFWLTKHDVPNKSLYSAYRDILNKEFKPKFYKLDI